MHIPDGYLSPSTCAALYAASAPFIYVATRKVKRLVSARLAPLLSVFAAFSFVIMMLNVPLPGGTSGHAVGATLATIVLGPWAAMLAVAVALAIQALFFGDGGILSLGANVFNMAVVMSLVASAVYRVFGGSAESPRRKMVAGAAAGYVGLNVAAFLTAVEFGIQPALFRAADGAPLYAPYGLDVSIPAMMIGHLFIAGPAEAIITALAVAFIARTNPDLLSLSFARSAARSTVGRLRALWVGLAALAVLTPLGLFATGTAWGEWNPTNPTDWPLQPVPQGLAALSGLWRAPLPAYATRLLGAGTFGMAIGYLMSAVVGIALLALVGMLIGRVLARGEEGPPGGIVEPTKPVD